jgi:hypothetical protein
MAENGDWNLVIGTPMGDRGTILKLKSAGGVLTGTQADENSTSEIFDGTVSGNDVAWKVTLTTPIAITLEFKGTIVGDAMTGQANLGAFGTYSFTGKRV